MGFGERRRQADRALQYLFRLFQPAHLHQYRAQQSQHVDVFRVPFNGFPANGLGRSRVAGVDQLKRFIEYGFGGINLSHIKRNHALAVTFASSISSRQSDMFISIAAKPPIQSSSSQKYRNRSVSAQ